MPLNDRQIRNAKPADKLYKLTDGSGLYLTITPAGGKLWRLDYAINGKRKTLSIGKYPAVSLLEARQAAEMARADLAKGIDPAAVKQQAKAQRQAALQNTFENIARRWYADNLHRWKPNHAARLLAYLEKDVFPAIGGEPIDAIRVNDIKSLLADVLARGAINTAEKIRDWIGAVFDYAAMLEITDRNPARALKGFLPKRQTEHMPALPREELTEFFRRLLLADIKQQNRIAVLLIMLLFVRNTELRGGRWAEIDYEARLWTIPAERMKRPRVHTVPLAAWPLELLRELHALTGNTPYLFPSRTNAEGFISNMTLSRIIGRMGYKGIATIHGFRSLASSVLNEAGFNRDAIERQLAHVEENRIRAAYNRADYMAERREMMDWYADFLRRHYQAAMTDTR
jgi:site-specific recombinase, phage integrase family